MREDVLEFMYRLIRNTPMDNHGEGWRYTRRLFLRKWSNLHPNLVRVPEHLDSNAALVVMFGVGSIFAGIMGIWIDFKKEVVDPI